MVSARDPKTSRKQQDISSINSVIFRSTVHKKKVSSERWGPPRWGTTKQERGCLYNWRPARSTKLLCGLWLARARVRSPFCGPWNLGFTRVHRTGYQVLVRQTNTVQFLQHPSPYTRIECMEAKESCYITRVAVPRDYWISILVRGWLIGVTGYYSVPPEGNRAVLSGVRIPSPPLIYMSSVHLLFVCWREELRHYVAMRMEFNNFSIGQHKAIIKQIWPISIFLTL